MANEGQVTAAQQELADIAEAIWDFRSQRELYLATLEGIPIPGLPDISLEDAGRRAVFAREQLARLERLDLARLTYAEQVDCKVFQWDLLRLAEEVDTWWHRFPVTPYASPLGEAQRVMALIPLKSPERVAEYLRLVEQVPDLARAMLKKAQQQREAGILVPAEALDLAIASLAGFRQAPVESPFWVTPEQADCLGTFCFRNTIEQTRFYDRLARVIEDQINPGLEALVTTLSGEYRQTAPEQVGLWQYPGGEQAYRLLIHAETSLPLTPEEIHRRGVEAVATLNAEMAEIRGQLGFRGTKEEFHTIFQRDPRFIASSAEEVGEHLMGYIRRIEPRLSQVFLTLPQAGYGVRRLRPEYEGAQTFGYYDAPNPDEPCGYYYYNGSDLENRPLFSAASLIYHELLPGHHLQVARQRETPGLPRVRRHAYHNAYAEGWAEYATGLAGELGMYADPYERYGCLSSNIFIAMRLVVDTGMNALGWPRQRAVEVMRANLLESDVQIHTESLRYSSDIPAQALAYRLGHEKILELRERQKQALGAAFDLRVFHEQVLNYGDQPLPVLEWSLAQPGGQK